MASNGMGPPDPVGWVTTVGNPAIRHTAEPACPEIAEPINNGVHKDRDDNAGDTFRLGGTG